MRLDRYLARLGEPAPSSASADALAALHAAHRQTFLFENLTIQAGGRISLAICDLERKFVDERRGGYCFEHNTLFAAALREAGFTSASLLGRVRRGPKERWCRTHLVLRVPVDGEVWLADVGFGALGLIEPIRLVDGETVVQGGLTYRLRQDDHLWVLSAIDRAGDTTDLYEFTVDPQTRWDIEVANHFTATHPESIFRKSLTIQRTAGAERTMLRTEALTRYVDGRRSEQTIARTELADVARREFGVTLPPPPLVFERVA